MTRRKKYVHNKKLHQSRHYASAGIGLGLGVFMSLAPLGMAYAKRMPISFVGIGKNPNKKQATSKPETPTTSTQQTGSGSAVPSVPTDGSTQTTVIGTVAPQPVSLPNVDGPCSSLTVTANQYSGSNPWPVGGFDSAMPTSALRPNGVEGPRNPCWYRTV